MRKVSPLSFFKASHQMKLYVLSVKANRAAYRLVLGPIYESSKLLGKAYEKLSDDEKDLVNRLGYL